MEDEKFYTTLRKFFKRQGITQQEIGKVLGTSQSYVNSLFSGRNPIGKATAQKFSEAYGLSVAWLLTGEGEMMKKAKPSGSVSASGGSVAVSGNNTATNNAAGDLIASLALSEGIPIEVVSKMLAHTSVKTTEIYAKVMPQRVLDAYAQLAEALGSGKS